MKLLKKGRQRAVRTSFEEDERLFASQAHVHESLLRLSFDVKGRSLWWFVSEDDYLNWLLSYWSELNDRK
jgi:hypothetical protein